MNEPFEFEELHKLPSDLPQEPNEGNAKEQVSLQKRNKEMSTRRSSFQKLSFRICLNRFMFIANLTSKTTISVINNDRQERKVLPGRGMYVLGRWS
jgi:hypothetical protein